MSIPVELGRLAETLRSFGSGYLLTSGGGQVKAVTVDPRAFEGAVLELPGSRGSLANLAENPAATLLFPPLKPKGYTLLVDGSAEGDGEAIRFTPATAVLHRPASHSDGPPAPEAAGEQTGCGNDCRPVE
ncbi:pyridoxamine 5'-phosphate oxidase [Nocardioides rotundus]|uniref:pyridoxamine 5'-phosphate oxidase n=1 Tax=Nocardioides rotundus TaxID=1774216 RepID=UPI001CBD6880|nr:pyridoxamine 5'-phosphate oxidase [Nocardioides rotundus]UAL30619.1 pyridoxamine 5'-phosphate oxidase [Nocardioides rotundus]